ncbi:MAG: phytoene/squalene synthase family protein [Sphingomonadaceae bacterium]|nr:phytoene/squalene synthase family protein [Sphingomonadaceae bacterium]
MRHRAALVEKARAAIAEGSQSFAAASTLFDKHTREKVWLLYAWCRRCDDIADAQDMGGELGDQSHAADRLKAIRVLTERAFDGLPTADPAFDAFGLVARECGITRAMADDVIAGFALDATDWRPRSEADLMRYCFHVAGAVGVMMAVVMGVSPQDEETLDRACDLGLAFQLANIARDIEEDDAAGRCYLPIEWLVEQDIEPGQHMKPHHRGELVEMTEKLLTLMEEHAAASRMGAARLPFRSRWAILSATRIYTAIGHDVRQRGIHAWDHRAHTTGLQKAGHVTAAFFEALANRPRRVTLPRWNRRELAAMAQPANSATQPA